MASTREIITAVLFGDTYNQISRKLKCSRRDVSTAHKIINTHQLTLTTLAQLSDQQLVDLKPEGPATTQESVYLSPDYATTLTRLKTNPHYTLLLDWRYYLSEASTTGKKPYSYSHFCEKFNTYVDTHDLHRTIAHQPGRTMQVDWAGDTITLADVATKDTRKVYFFIAILPYSSMMFVYPSLSMDLRAWISAHIAALRYFGGAPFAIVPDNASTAIYRPKKSDPARAVTTEYDGLAKFYNTAIMPADIRSPQHKAKVERSVQIAYTKILSVLVTEGPFHRLDQIEELVADLVYEINYELVRVDGTTRSQQFDQEERDLLAPLPDTDYTTYEWKYPKVQRNYHIVCDKKYYSVPWKLVGSTVKARLSTTEITIISGDNVVATHDRRHGRFGQYSTHPEHVPPQHLKDSSTLWSDAWFINQAKLFGPATAQVITMMINRHTHHAHGWLDCQNVLKTLGAKSRSALELACQEIIDADLYPTYSVIEKLQGSVIATREKQQRGDATAPVPAPKLIKPTPVVSQDPDVFLRDATAYDVDDTPAVSFDDEAEG